MFTLLLGPKSLLHYLNWPNM